MWQQKDALPPTAASCAVAFTSELAGFGIQQEYQNLDAEMAACGPPRPPHGQQPLAAHPVVRNANYGSNDSAKSFHTGNEQVEI